jgi:hypothetical protein
MSQPFCLPWIDLLRKTSPRPETDRPARKSHVNSNPTEEVKRLLFNHITLHSYNPAQSDERSRYASWSELTLHTIVLQASVIGQSLVKLCMESDWTKQQYDETSTRLLVEGIALPRRMRREKW